MTAPHLSVIVPTYNERECLAALVDAVLAAGAAAGMVIEMIVVDDNSPDGTGALADELAARRPMTVVHRPGKQGLGAAVAHGFTKATADVVAVMDADFSHPPAIVPRLFQAFVRAQADMLVASRYVPGGATRNWPVERKIYSWLACQLARPLSPVRDPVSGFFFIRRQLAQDTVIEAPGFKVCLELLVRSAPRRVVEAPFCFNDREGGKSKMSIREALRFVSQFVALYRVRLGRRASRPAYVRLTSADLT